MKSKQREYLWQVNGEVYDGTQKYVEDSMLEHIQDRVGDLDIGSRIFYRGVGGKKTGEDVSYTEAFRLEIDVAVRLVRDSEHDVEPTNPALEFAEKMEKVLEKQLTETREVLSRLKKK